MLAFIQMAPELDETKMPHSFCFSNGWLANFKSRHNMTSRIGPGEEGDVDMRYYDPLFKGIASLLEGVDPALVYTCGETGLYIKIPTNGTLSSENVHGRKIVKDACVSILFCCSADGSDKRPPFVLCKIPHLSGRIVVNTRL